MSLWRQLTHGLRALVERAASDRDLTDEVQQYIDAATAAHLARGLTPHEARRAAQLEIGNATVVREQVRAYGWENVVETIAADVRYAARRLRHTPGFTIVCALTLAVGIGASTAIFSTVDPILLRPLPYPDADRLLMINDRLDDGGPLDATYGTYLELAARARSFSTMAATDRWHPALTGDAEPQRLDGERITASYFRTLGVRPLLGRDFSASDDQPHGPNVVILSDGLFRRRFGGDRSIIGRPITLDGDLYTVVGIMPPDFENVLTPGGSIWAPLQAEPNTSFNSREWGHHYRIVGRLGPGVTADGARRELASIARAPVAAFARPPWARLANGLRVHRLQDDVTSGVRAALLAALGAVLLVLAIACVNVTNLLLARAAQRQGEFAMRSALGAGRPRLAQQLITESLLLASLGALLGLGVAQLGVRAVVALSPAGLPRASAIHVDGAALAFAVALTTIVGVLVGLAPALAASRGDLHAHIQQASSRTTRGVARRTLVVAEVALALMLLVGAGLLLRSLERLFSAGPGFDASHVLTMQVTEAGHAYGSDTARYQFFVNALEAVRHVPGVTAAAFTSQLPLSGDNDAYGVVFESIPRSGPNDYGNAFRYAVTPDYFAAMRIPLRRGRLLDAHDLPVLDRQQRARGITTGAPEPVVINESMARRLFPGKDPLGQHFRAGPEIGATTRPWDVVVGVVGDVKQMSLALDQPDAFYVATGQWWWVDNVQTLVVRTSGDPAALAPSVRNAIWSVDRNQPISRVTTMSTVLAASESQRHFAFVIFESFALAALVLATIGIYGVLAASVAARLREIGVRAALGASRRSIVKLVLRQGLSLTAAGIAIGVVAAAIATRAIASLLYGVSRLDPVTYAGVLVLLAAASLVACALPAWRAAGVDPLIALRAE